MSFGDRLIKVRKDHGYTREALAQELGISKFTLRNYELEATEPGHTFLKMISDFFNVSVDYLMELTDEKEILHAFQLRSSEQDIVEKYRYIEKNSPEGAKTVNYVLDREYTIAERMMKLEEDHRKNTENTINPMPKLPEADITALENAMSVMHEEKKKFNGKNWLNK